MQQCQAACVLLRRAQLREVCSECLVDRLQLALGELEKLGKVLDTLQVCFRRSSCGEQHTAPLAARMCPPFTDQ